MSSRRMVIIGAGPMGLEAALGAIERGFDVTVLEAGRIGESLRRWGPTRLFTPMEMNLSERARTLLADDAPAPDAILSGPEMVAQVLEPLAEREPLAGHIRTGCRVVSVSRRKLARHDHAGHPIRQERAFRLLVDTEAGEEEIEADVVLDASGIYGQPLSTGAGGPAVGEREASARILRSLGELHDNRMELIGKRIAVVGNGHSAANAINAVSGWIDGGEGPASVAWLTRARRENPCVETPADPLPERLRVTREANALASTPPEWLTVHRHALVRRFESTPEGLKVELSNGDTVTVDYVISLTGYRPNLDMLRELALDIAPATEGAGRLYRAVSNITDCMSVPKVEPKDLFSGETGFYTIGAKSYGRSRTFLLNTGRMQMETILDIEADRLS